MISKIIKIYLFLIILTNPLLANTKYYKEGIDLLKAKI